MSHVLKTSELRLVARGGGRLVFEHPQNGNWLIKLDGPGSAHTGLSARPPWYKRHRRLFRYRKLFRELSEYVISLEGRDSSPRFSQRIVGLVETDAGLGLVTEALRDRDGRLAPTLRELLESGRFDDAARADLETFCQDLLASDMFVCDLTPVNLVHAWEAGKGTRFVMIDGQGTKTVLPLARLCRFANRLCKRVKIRRLWRAVSSAARRDARAIPSAILPAFGFDLLLSVETLVPLLPV